MKHVWLIMILVLATMAYAETPYTIEFIKGYVENERDTSVDEDGGTIDAQPGDLVELQIKIQNDYSENIDIKYDWTIENIDDGDDVEKEIDYFEVEVDEDMTKTLSFIVDSNADEDTYDAPLTISHRYDNGTKEDTEIDISVRVKEDKVADEDMFLRYLVTVENLSNTCSEVIDNMTYCFGYIDELKTYDEELDKCKEERGLAQSDKSIVENDLTNCQNTKDEAQREKEECQSQLNNNNENMITENECNNRVVTAESAASSKANQNWLLFGGIAGAVIFIIYRSRKNKSYGNATGVTDYPER